MQSSPLKLSTLIVFSVMAGFVTAAGSQAIAQPATARPIPQSLRVGHEATVEQLSALANRKGPVGEAARKALVVFRRHIAREQEFILPPLTLLPRLADGKVTPDMAWALPMLDRVRAEREEIFEEHTRITDALNLLTVAAARAHDKAAKEFAETAAADSLNDMEVLEPTLLLIGEILHSKLPAGGSIR